MTANSTTWMIWKLIIGKITYDLISITSHATCSLIVCLYIHRVFRWFTSFRTQSEMEFKVFHELFCDQFKILTSEFQFDSYVERVYEKLLLDIITIRPLDWFIVVFLSLLNLGRVKLGMQYGHSCASDHSYCDDIHSIKLFCILGVVMLAVSVILAVVSRMYLRRLLSSRGVESFGDCIVFLRVSFKYLISSQ